MTARGVKLQRDPEITCGTEVWIAVALLTRENPEREDFTVPEILQRLSKENVRGELRQGVPVHISAHCCGNKPSSPATLRMLYATGRSTRRLFNPLQDEAHPTRSGRAMPDAGEVPVKYQELLDWWKKKIGWVDEPAKACGPPQWLSGLRAMKGFGRGIYGNADEYVRSLREGWE